MLYKTNVVILYQHTLHFTSISPRQLTKTKAVYNLLGTTELSGRIRSKNLGTMEKASRDMIMKEGHSSPNSNHSSYRVNHEMLSLPS